MDGSFLIIDIHQQHNGYQDSKLATPNGHPYIDTYEPTYLQEQVMINAPATSNYAAAPSHSLWSLIVAFLTLNLREKLDPEYTGQDSDPAYYGCGL